MSGGPHTWILGLGVTGLGTLRYLKGQGDDVAVWDSRSQPPGGETLATEYPDVTLRTGPFDGAVLSQAKRLVVNPGIALATPAIQQALAAGVEVIGDIELFARAADAPVIAITGSNGKSTVTTLVGEMAEAAGWSVGIGGNIGTAALELLGKGHQLYVLELSSFQLETTFSLKPAAATVLNVSDDHLDRYDGFDHYRDTKLTIYRGAGLCLENRADSDTCFNEPTAAGARVQSFGLDLPEGDNFGLRGDWICQGETPLVRTDTLATVGRHNILNAMAALALGQAVGLPLDAMAQALSSFSGLAHRCELVATRSGVQYVNDSKATNVGATLAALEGLEDHPGKVWLIAGGDAKGADLSELAPALAAVAGVFTLGKDGPAIAALKPKSQHFDSLEATVEAAAAAARSGDIVLLSPACASLDMFSNFAQRGERFAALARALS